jgi:hypothetical protein
MNFELVAVIILFGSLSGMGVIVFRKITFLVGLPEIPAAGINWGSNFLKLKEKIKILNPFKSFSQEVFLQKILSKIRILSLKSENKTGNWLQRLREKSQKNKFQEDDNYWEEIKKSTQKK